MSNEFIVKHGLISKGDISFEANTISGTGEIKLADNGKMYFGGGNDLSFYHDGSNSYIDSKTGNLDIKAGTSYIRCPLNGDMEFWNEGAARVITSNAGIELRGDLDMRDND